jgi:hypothetical protein
MKVSDLVDRLRAIAMAKESVDFQYGRKGPLYGKETEVEWQAADLLEAQAKAIEEMRELLSTGASGWTEGSPMDEIWQKRRDKVLASHSKGGE